MPDCPTNDAAFYEECIAQCNFGGGTLLPLVEAEPLVNTKLSFSQNSLNDLINQLSTTLFLSLTPEIAELIH